MDPVGIGEGVLSSKLVKAGTKLDGTRAWPPPSLIAASSGLACFIRWSVQYSRTSATVRFASPASRGVPAALAPVAQVVEPRSARAHMKAKRVAPSRGSDMHVASTFPGRPLGD
jgi:hypothetical protein